MSSEQLKTQILFQDILGDNDYKNFIKKKKTDIVNFSISKNHAILFETTLKEDALDFYYKGIVSLIESLISLSYKGFSWATVKMYYSIFYFLRSSLCLNNIGFVRQARDGYYFVNEVGSNFIPLNSPDHKAAIDLFIKLYKRTDFLQSNNIDDKNPYEWIMKQRENVNYKYRTFFEPDISDTWNSISVSIDSDGLKYWINNYLVNNIYTFLNDHAIVAMPLQMLAITHKRFLENGVQNPVRLEKVPRVTTLIEKNEYLSFLENYI